MSRRIAADIAPLPRDPRAMRYLGYTHYPRAMTRPHCDMCGPFASAFMRPIGSDEFGTLHRCVGCDEE